jgi:hypothetical protein
MRIEVKFRLANVAGIAPEQVDPEYAARQLHPGLSMYPMSKTPYVCARNQRVAIGYARKDKLIRDPLWMRFGKPFAKGDYGKKNPYERFLTLKYHKSVDDYVGPAVRQTRRKTGGAGTGGYPSIGIEPKNCFPWVRDMFVANSMFHFNIRQAKGFRQEMLAQILCFHSSAQELLRHTPRVWKQARDRLERPRAQFRLSSLDFHQGRTLPLPPVAESMKAKPKRQIPAEMTRALPKRLRKQPLANP